MSVFRFVISGVCTLGLIIFLNNSWNIGGTPLPPLGKFLDPYHGFWQNIEKPDHKPAKELTIQGLHSPVTITFDSLMVPHIFARDEQDLYLAQGYVTAMHRLWQMEFQTHAAAGRVSEIISGDAILNFDRSQRRLGMVHGAEQALAYMESNDTIRRIIKKYTAGVNQFIQSLEYGKLPFEYKLLGYEPEPWTPLKCALLLKDMSKTLNIGDKDMEMTNALKLFGKAYVDLLYPDNENCGDPIVDAPGTWNFIPVTLDSVNPALPAELINVAKTGLPDPTVGSNNWAVSGKKTATGAPILCNDPHLQLTLPSIWYVVQLHGPGIHAMGASLPGAPGIIIGFNDSIAWGITNAQRDLVDWYKITYDSEKKERYRSGTGWKKTNRVVEAFRIRGGSTFYDTITYTEWGPVTYDRSFHAEDDLSDYAFRWISHDRSEEIMAIYKLNRAKNHAEFMRATTHFSSPGQNFVFASVSGDVAIRVQGKFPVRRKDEGKFVLDGSKPEHGWQAFIPADQNVTQKNPERGFVSSANQFPVDSTYPYYITATNYEAYRNRRINQVLSQSSNITVEDMMRLQADNFNLKASESLPLFLNLLDTTKFSEAEKQAYAVLKNWDFYNDVNSQGASYYESWWNALMPLTWDEMDRDDAILIRPTTYNTIRLIREKPGLEFFDILETEKKETAREVVQASFTAGVNNIQKWIAQAGTGKTDVPWGSFKASSIAHLLPPMKALSIPVNTGGNRDIVNAHSRTNGPSWRMIVSLEKSGVKAFGTYPGGQSGNPGSPFYSNLLPRWTRGETYPLLFLRAPTTEGIYATTTLNPN